MVRWRTEIQRELHRGLRDALGGPTAERFARLGITTVGDLMRHTPRRYLSGTELTDFASLQKGEDVAVVARVERSNLVNGRQLRVEADLTDGAERLRIAFFTNKATMAKYWLGALKPGSRGIFVGKVGMFRDEPQLAHPDFVIIDDRGQVIAGKKKVESGMFSAVQKAQMVGLYPATAQLPTWTIAASIELLLPGVVELGDTLPHWVVEAAGVLPLDRALLEVHQPVDRAQAELGIERLRFDEAFGMQLAMAHRRARFKGQAATPRPRRGGGLLEAFDGRLPFELTAGQREIADLIFDELAAPSPMHRLLQGEVGSGKTVVALRAMLAVVDAGGQAVMLAPTEVLANQHHATITRMLGDLGMGGQLGAHPEATTVALLTGSRGAAARREALSQIADGTAGIIVGTHALLSDPVEFADLGLVVIDEQHRFGVEQRAALAAKSEQQPHTLVMTATPIPRSVAMTVFGDLEVSELRQLPSGRQQVQTVAVDTRNQPGWVDRAWERIREEVGQGRQAFVVCPAITGKQVESPLEEGADLTAVTELLPELEAGPLNGLRLGMVHGKQPAAEREETMAEFAAGRIDVLVATTVIEVGVDVPNASVMVVMDADRFGIAQLHQLRGRIGRGEHPGLCLLMFAAADPEDLRYGESPAAQRLRAVAATTDGFALAEEDLALRREGDVLGAAQSGQSSLKLLRVLADADVIRSAKELAERVLADKRADDDPRLADLITAAKLVAAGEWLEKT